MKFPKFINTILWLWKPSIKYEENKENTIAAIEENFHITEQRVTEDEKENKASIRIDDEYIALLETQKNTLSDIHQKLLNNILNIMKDNEHSNLTNDDIKIQDGKLYLCGTMFYGELLDETKRKKEHLINPDNIINDWHQKAFKSLVDFTTKLYGDRFIWYTHLNNGKFQGGKAQIKQYFFDLNSKNENFLKKMTSVISWIDFLKPDNENIEWKYMYSCSIPLCVDEQNNVFYYDQYNRIWLSGIWTNSYEIRSNIYQYEFIS